MLNNKTLRRLFIITTVCAVPILLIAIKPSVSAIKNKDAIFLPDLLKSPEKITRLIIQDNNSTLTFENKNDSWRILEKNNFPVIKDRVEEVLFALSDLRVVEPKTTNQQLYAELDLTDVAAPNSKALLVTVQDGQQHDLAKILIGKREGLRLSEGYVENIFVRSVGDSQAWLVRGSLPLSSDFKDWVDQPLLGLINTDQLKQLEVTNPNGEKVIIRKNTQEQQDFVLVTAKDKPGMTLNIDSINTMPFDVAELEFDDVCLAADQDIDWSKSVTAELETFAGMKVALSIVKNEVAIYSKVTAIAMDETNEDQKQIATTYNNSKQEWYYKLSPQVYNSIILSNTDLLKTN